MMNCTVRVARIRTTHDGSGRACGIVTGMGVTPGAALAALEREAEALAQHVGQLAAEAADASDAAAKEAAKEAAARRAAETAAEYDAETARLMEKYGGAGWPAGARGGPSRRQPVEPVPARPEDDGPRYYVFEAVDLRLTRAAMEDGGTGWLAYGTMGWVGNPQQTGTTSGSSGSSGSSRDDRGGSRDDRGGRAGRKTPWDDDY